MKSLPRRRDRTVTAAQPPVDQMTRALIANIDLATDAEVQAMLATICNEEDFAAADVPIDESGQPGSTRLAGAPLSIDEIAIVRSLYDRVMARAMAHGRSAR
jgi:hypothetical protein